jgi:hypothetical protein
MGYSTLFATVSRESVDTPQSPRSDSKFSRLLNPIDEVNGYQANVIMVL